MARAVARDLAARGVVVVSGLALGIDAVAHEAALEATAGATRLATVAVLGCGADVEHPPGNRRLFALVRERGLIVSEVSWGVGARPWRFPARNRLMAALCEAVVVVEGSERSGALITARHALDLGREVLAVPGEAGRRLSAGPHRLLRQGAAVCESAADVLEIIGCGGLAIGWKGRALQVGATAGPNAQTGSGAAGGRDDIGVGTARDTAHDAAAGPVQRLVRALDDGAQTVDGLAAGAGLGTASALALLAELEVEGVVEACGGGAYRLRRDA